MKAKWILASLAVLILASFAGYQNCGKVGSSTAIQSAPENPELFSADRVDKCAGVVDGKNCPVTEGGCDNCNDDRISRYRAVLIANGDHSNDAVCHDRFPVDTNCNTQDAAQKFCITKSGTTETVKSCLDSFGSFSEDGAPPITRGISKGTFGHTAVTKDQSITLAFRARLGWNCHDLESQAYFTGKGLKGYCDAAVKLGVFSGNYDCNNLSSSVRADEMMEIVNSFENYWKAHENRCAEIKENLNK